MTLDNYRSHAKIFTDPLVSIFIKLRITPNILTIAALLASAAAGILFYLRLELWGIVAVAVNAFCDMMDGAVAREMKIQSLRGDFLDHAVDRYADIFIICGLFAGGLVPVAGRCLCPDRCPDVILPWHAGSGSRCRKILWRDARPG